MNLPSLALPADFRWGVSTSAYQIEGAASADGRGPSIWDTFSHTPGNVRHGDTGDVACDHYHRHAEDVALLSHLGVGAYRFSVSWSRVLPDGRGQANRAGLDFYDRLTDDLLARGIEPWVCLYHWDLPQALQDKGGWRSRDCAQWFADYALLMARRLGDRVSHFATLNEPTIVALFGHLWGTNAPGIADSAAWLDACHHLNLAHGAGSQAIRAVTRDARIGCIHTFAPARPASPSADDTTAATRLDLCWNRMFADPQVLGHYPQALADLVGKRCLAGDERRICQPQDWIGINHYSPLYARADTSPAGFALADAPAGGETSGIGWPVDPDAFRDILLEVNERYALPVHVAENGYGAIEQSTPGHALQDSYRIRYMTRYLEALQEAIDEGADVRSYFAWTLLDNFEWAFGYDYRFGLVHVDRTSGQRTPKASADWYRQVIAANSTPRL